MKRVAKLILVDQQNNYLMLWRSSHPTFGQDPDLPGGTLEEGEVPIDTMIREVFEETQIHLSKNHARHLYTGTDYSTHGTEYSLYWYRVTLRPKVVLSWEHSSYEWVSRDAFLQKAGDSIDTYMHMVHAIATEKLPADSSSDRQNC